MTFSRANALGFALYETFYSPQANTIDINQSRAIDGYAGGTYNPSSPIILNQQFEVNSTGAAAANVVGIVATGKGTSAGVSSTGGATDGVGVIGTGGGTDGWGVVGFGPAVPGADVVVFYAGGGTDIGVGGQGGPANGHGVYGHGYNSGYGVLGIGGANDAPGVVGNGGSTNGIGGDFTGAGTGSGLDATGGAAGGRGINATGTGSSVGIYATGGPINGPGMQSLGQGSGEGAIISGGATAGVGVRASGGAGGGVGVIGNGGTGGAGVAGYGNTTGVGVYGEGGATDAIGGRFVGGGTNGIGLRGEGQGTGRGVVAMCDASSANLALAPKVGDPTVPAEGDIWAESGDDELIAYFAARKHQLLDTWVSITVIGGAPGAVTVNNQNNVSSATIDGAGAFIQINFAKSFSAAKHFATVAITDGTRFVQIVNDNVTGYVQLRLVNHDGTLVDMNATSYELRVVVKGLFA